MNTDWIIIILLGCSVVLFLISFFLPDATKDLKEEIEQLSLKVYQDHYKINRRLKVLEEELLLPTSLESVPKASAPNPIIAKQIELLYRQGLPIDQIAKQSALPIEDVESIIKFLQGTDLK